MNALTIVAIYAIAGTLVASAAARSAAAAVPVCAAVGASAPQDSNQLVFWLLGLIVLLAIAVAYAFTDAWHWRRLCRKLATELEEERGDTLRAPPPISLFDTIPGANANVRHAMRPPPPASDLDIRATIRESSTPPPKAS